MVNATANAHTIAMDVSPTFRPATLYDVPDVVALVESAYRGDASKEGWTTEADLLDGQRTDPLEVEEAITAPDSLLILAHSGHDLVGCCHLERRTPSSAYFGMFSVRPGLQGKGWGRAIVGHVEDHARKDWECRAMSIHVIGQRAELIAWYERLGYRQTGETLPFPYGDPRFGIPRRPDLEFIVLSKDLIA